MELSVRVVGLEQARAQLLAAGKKVDPVLRGALNTTATKSRTERYMKPMGALFKASVLGARLGNTDLRGKLAIKRAKRGRMNSRIIPSSSGVRVDDYRRWVYEILSPTRARIYVYGLGGRKVAAGFVNPASARQSPLSTRGGRTTASANREILRAALGPSAAFWFRKLSGSGTIAWVNAYLQQEFRKRMNRELSK